MSLYYADLPSFITLFLHQRCENGSALSPSVSLWLQAYRAYAWHWRQGHLQDTFFIDLIQITAASSTYSCSDELGGVARSSKEMLVDTVSIIIYTRLREN